MVNSLIPWGIGTPQPMQILRRDMDSVFNRFFNDFDRWEPMALFNPTTDVAETENGYEVKMDLPGMDSEGVNVEWENGQLWITGERKDEREENGKTFHSVERRYGQFRRGIPLPQSINQDGIKASFKDGVLTVHVPKSEQARPKRIPVNKNS